MYKRRTEGWLKHLDFILLDIGALNISFFAAYFIRHGVLPFKTNSYYIFLAFMLSMGDFVYIIMTAGFHRVIRRGYWDEAKSCMKSGAFVVALASVMLFLLKTGTDYSRFVVFTTGIFYLGLNYILRVWRKYYLRRKSGDKNRSILIAADKRNINTVIDSVKKRPEDWGSVRGIILLDGEPGEEGYPVPVVANRDDMLSYITRSWVDELLVFSDNHNDNELEELFDTIVESGVALHRIIDLEDDEKGFSRVVESVGGFKVITESLRIMTGKQIFLKRCLDIAGGIVGTILTGVILLFVAPIIKIQSPGPVIFKQQRIGRNGKIFTIYKIRSMYMDAEERKKELMEKNTMQGNMFKLENDPRIIGSKTLPDGTYKKGIGNFIRDYSLDEFPQFINVVKGDMSLVGTRPPTVDEWEKYTPYHRARMTFRPGVTGMWQISGRSDITDFEEVVKLDMQYINNWTPALDFRIIAKTVLNVIKKDGAK